MISTLRVSKIYRKSKGKSKNLKSEENPKKKQRTVNGKLVHSPHGLGVSSRRLRLCPLRN